MSSVFLKKEMKKVRTKEMSELSDHFSLGDERNAFAFLWEWIASWRGTRVIPFTAFTPMKSGRAGAETFLGRSPLSRMF